MPRILTTQRILYVRGGHFGITMHWLYTSNGFAMPAERLRRMAETAQDEAHEERMVGLAP